MDAVTFDHLLAELSQRLVGRHLGRVLSLGPHAIGFELPRGAVWMMDVERAHPTLVLADRGEIRSLSDKSRPPTGRTRQGLLLFRKHLAGARVTRIHRVVGHRTALIETTDGLVSFRLSGPAPALTLVVDEVALATLGEGPSAWPAPEPEPEREWDRLAPERFAEAVTRLRASGWSLTRAVLAACPELGPWLARQLDGTAVSFAALRDLLSSPRPTILTIGLLDRLSDGDLASPDAVALTPGRGLLSGPTATEYPSWNQAALVAHRLRSRGLRFAIRQKSMLNEARREIRRLSALEAHLARDLDHLADESALRRQGEALLTAASIPTKGVAEVEVPDPYHEHGCLRIEIDPRLTLPGNADRFFAKARRIERARAQIANRGSDTRQALDQARGRERRALSARDIRDLDLDREPSSKLNASSQPRRYATSRGLPILVGRSARENHHLTFVVAQPDDLWLHAREVAGAHVILLDREGRGNAEDFREAAEIAAFFSQAREETRVDVHLARRKHVRASGGGSGRVRIAHSETLRVTPRDPEGQKRRR